ncbi:MAG: hypothetical protein ACTSVR_04885 [Candidatus Thorarchaeota archaeon]
MTKKIRNLTDKEWISEEELGTIEEDIEYQNGEETLIIHAVAHVLSGSELDAIEAKYTSIDLTAEEGEGVTVDQEGYQFAKMCATFKLDEISMKKVFNNKSSDLRMKLMMLMNRASGVSDTSTIEKEKNSESPEV